MFWIPCQDFGTKFQVFSAYTHNSGKINLCCSFERRLHRLSYVKSSYYHPVCHSLHSETVDLQPASVCSKQHFPKCTHKKSSHTKECIIRWSQSHDHPQIQSNSSLFTVWTQNVWLRYLLTDSQLSHKQNQPPRSCMQILPVHTK